MKNIKKFFFSIILLIFLYSFFIEPSLIVKVENYKYDYGLKNKIKILAISDLHINKYYFFHDIIINKIKKIKPDIILYAGDTLTKTTDKDSIIKFFSKLNEISQVYAVYGNWDYYDINKLNSAYNQAGIKIIDDTTLKIYIKESPVILTGVPMYKTNNTFEYDNSLNIVITHVPSRILRYKDILNHSDLIISGHTHGGQVNLPFISDYIFKNYLKEPYFKGIYDLENTKVYVSSGLGSWYNVRFLNPPTITLFEYY